jgi:hypothetical protein
VNVQGLVFWILIGATLCVAVLFVGLLASIINASHLERERERRREEWEEARGGD